MKKRKPLPTRHCAKCNATLVRGRVGLGRMEQKHRFSARTLCLPCRDAAKPNRKGAYDEL